MPELQPVRAFVDEIGGGIAKLLVDEDEVPLYVPRRWLPRETREGSVLLIRFEADEQVTREGKAEVEGLLEELEGRP